MCLPRPPARTAPISDLPDNSSMSIPKRRMRFFAARKPFPRSSVKLLTEDLAKSVVNVENPGLPLHLGDFRQLANTVPDDSVDLIFTDPPYVQSGVSLFGDLARFAGPRLAARRLVSRIFRPVFLPEVDAYGPSI